MAVHNDHQVAIISEKLKLLKISFPKAEQKQGVVGVLNGKDVMEILPKQVDCFGDARNSCR